MKIGPYFITEYVGNCLLPLVLAMVIHTGKTKCVYAVLPNVGIM